MPKQKKSLAEQVADKYGIESPQSPPPVVFPEDTTKRSALEHLVGSLGGSSNYIENMEAQGQRQLTQSTTIPSRINGDYGGKGEAQLKAMGFELGPIPKGSDDDIFRPALLPKGWKKVATDHSMWSEIHDEKGFARISMFYKAAFYDRSAHLNLNVRLHTEDDWEEREKTGTIRSFITAVMPGQDAKGDRNKVIVHTIECPETFPDHKEARGYAHPFFVAQDNNRMAAKEWLKANFPDHEDPTAYWDRTFA